MCVVCIDLGENWRNLNFIVQNCMIDMCWCSIDNVVCKIDDPKKVRIWYRVDESVWMPIFIKELRYSQESILLIVTYFDINNCCFAWQIVYQLYLNNYAHCFLT